MKRQLLQKVLTIIIVLLALCFGAFAVYAEEAVTVRVGWFESPFNRMDKFGRRSGYAYEYQQKIAAYTGWNYKYVEGSWPELLEKLQKGEIDLLADVSLTPERKQQMYFSASSMGTENYYVFSAAGNKEFSLDNLGALNGKKIGVNKHSVQKGMFLEWARKNKLQTNLVDLVGNDAASNISLCMGSLDAVVANDAFDTFADAVPIAKIGSSRFYFAVSKARPELVTQLDLAMNKILDQNRHYNQELMDKYMVKATFSKFLAKEELDWLKQHGKIKVAYRDRYLPFSGRDEATGKPIGLIKDFVDAANQSIKNARFEFELIPFSSTAVAVEAVKKGEVDCIFPLGLTPYDAELNQLMITDCLAATDIYAIIRKSDANKFSLTGNAVIAHNLANYSYASVMQTSFPDWKSVPCSSTEECLQATAEHRADCVLVSNYRIHVLAESMQKHNLTYLSTGKYMEFPFAVSRDNKYLYSILNRIIHAHSESSTNASLAKYSLVEQKITLKKFVEDNLQFVLAIVAAFIAITILYLRSSRLRKETKELNLSLEKRQEDLEKALSEAEAANKAKTLFLNNMSHDIRTPMNAILGFTRLISKDKQNLEQIEKHVQKISDSGEYLLTIINNVLDMARIESGKATINEELISLSAEDKLIASMFEEELAKKKLHFSYTMEVEHDYIYTDIDKVNQILVNLVSNAIKYTPEGGSIKVLVKEFPSERPGYLKISTYVKDTGIGMSETFQKEIFEAFTRERNTTESGIIGTGLGMAIVKRLIDLLGGTIEIDSKLGKGTTFRFNLEHRIGEVPEVQNQKQDNEEADLQKFMGKRLLLAEDNDLNAEIACAILEEVGFEVERAADGVICVDMLNKAKAGYYVAILMDIQMPNMNGYQATQKIRQFSDPQKAQLPIIAMTANAFEEDRKAATEVGMTGFIAKPIDVEALLRTLKEQV